MPLYSPLWHKNLKYQIFPIKHIFILLAFKSQFQIWYWICRILTFRDFEQTCLWFTNSSSVDLRLRSRARPSPRLWLVGKLKIKFSKNFSIILKRKVGGRTLSLVEIASSPTNLDIERPKIYTFPFFSIEQNFVAKK
jgi:hypothetical protein